MAQQPYASVDELYQGHDAIENLTQRLLAAAGDASLQAVIPASVLVETVKRVAKLLHEEPPLVEVTPDGPYTRVIVVGDTHGQFHDVVNMLALVGGAPGPQQVMVWNGDYVDRGAWGAEILVLLCALKLRSPRHVFLVRGNHETATCTEVYGFKGELASKYGGRACRDVYAGCRKLFAEMPLAALIAGRTLVLHGGLFRKPPPPAPATRTSGRRAAAKAAAAAAAGGGRTTVRSSDGSALAAGDGDGERSAAASDSVLQVGSLDDLRRGSKGGEDPDPDDPSRVQELAADVLWSDPCPEPGLTVNDMRGVGLNFGPDVTQEFLSANGLALVLRSHEGPDARKKRGGAMPDVQQGWSVDHDVPAGKLITLFSAPDYPQFMPPGEERHGNQAAVAVLTAPHWSSPSFVQYTAVDRPPCKPYYELDE